MSTESTRRQQLPDLSDLHIRLVSKCNLNCKHCYASDWFVRSDVLDAKLVCRAIDEAIPLGLARVTFTGGEPTLHRDLATMLLHCVDVGVSAKLETNGLLLRKKNDDIVTVLTQNKDLLRLYISYDLAAQRGLSASEHEHLRQVIIDLHQAGVRVKVQTSLTEVNIHDLDLLLELARDYGIPQRFFFDPTLLGNGTELTPFDLDTVLETFRYLDSLGLDLDCELPPLITGRQGKTCGWGLHRCELMPNGDVTTCGPITFSKTNFIAGNLKEQALSEIWTNSAYFIGMREVQQADFRGVCGQCQYWESCRGSCRAYAWSKGEDWFSPYPLCQVFAERYPEQASPHLRPKDALTDGRSG
jgi:radical SAM protein with 4Fe4S-binding SPASM domain